MNHTLTIIVPIYNEEDNIHRLSIELKKYIAILYLKKKTTYQKKFTNKLSFGLM